MAYQNFGPCWMPFVWPPSSVLNYVLDASGEKIALIFPAPASGDITGVEFELGTVTTGDTLLVSLQDVSLTTGHPDESADQSVTVVVADSDDNVKKAVTFGAARTVVEGDLVACVIEFNSWVAGNMQIAGGTNATNARVGRAQGGTYSDSKAAGAWTIQAENTLRLAINYGGTYHPATEVQLPGFTTIAYNTGSGSDEYALRFNSPVPLKVRGALVHGEIDFVADFVLYDSDGTTPLATKSLDPDTRANNAQALYLCRFAPVTLAKDTAYRAALKPTSASSVTLTYVNATLAALLAQLGCGTSCYLSHRADAGGWTDVTTQRPGIFLLASAFDDGAGGAGGGGLKLVGAGGLAG